MESAELRKLAAALRKAAHTNDQARTEKAAQVLDAAVALNMLRRKVSPHG